MCAISCLRYQSQPSIISTSLLFGNVYYSRSILGSISLIISTRFYLSLCLFFYPSRCSLSGSTYFPSKMFYLSLITLASISEPTYMSLLYYLSHIFFCIHLSQNVSNSQLALSIYATPQPFSYRK